MIRIQCLRRSLLAFLVAFCALPVLAKKYDVLELPSAPSEMASKSLILAVKQYGDRYFATGAQGHILYSDDGGESWTQAQVPVRSTLTDVFFINPQLGWAAGHEGVILHSKDGGATWSKQYDGLRYGQEGLKFYQDLAASHPENPVYPLMIEEMEFAISQGADKPLFGVRFHTPTYGHAMGAYGMVLRTLDGGHTWEHAMHNTENEGFYHIFDSAHLPEQGKYFLTGEAGLLMVGDINERNARQVKSVPWEGSFFTTVASSDGAIVMGGLRGRMFRSNDAGDTWSAVKKPPTSAIVDSLRLDNGDLIAVGIGGELLRSSDNGMSFAPVKVAMAAPGNRERIYSAAQGPDNTLIVGGPSGLRKLSIQE